MHNLASSNGIPLQCESHTTNLASVNTPGFSSDLCLLPMNHIVRYKSIEMLFHQAERGYNSQWSIVELTRAASAMTAMQSYVY